MRQKISFRVMSSLLLLILITSCDKDNNGIEPTPNTPDTPTVVKLKTESLSGTWKLSREDNGIFISTFFNLHNDYTCEYTQTISSGEYYEDITEEDHKIELSGKWSFDENIATITFELNEPEGTGTLTLKANATGSSSTGNVESFKIADEYSANDDFCFKK